MPTSAATTVRSSGEVFDGPFAETKEQLLGFYVLDCANLDEAVEAARKLAGTKTSGSLEICPITWVTRPTPEARPPGGEGHRLTSGAWASARPRPAGVLPARHFP